MTRYDLLYAAATPLIAPWLLWRHFTKGKYTESPAGMRGKMLPAGEAALKFKDGSLWVHAVSVGEVMAARAVIPGLREVIPSLPLVVSTVTETGQATARRFYGEQDTVTYFPLDFSGNVRRFQAAFNPKVFVVLETELWPNFLSEAAARGTKCFMLNGKISDRSFPRYYKFRGFLKPVFQGLAGVATQTAADAERFAALGVPEARIRVAGNVKFDLKQKPLGDDEKSELAASLGMSEDRRWVVAGSTHPGEEAVMLTAFRELQRSFPEAGLLLCPRHPERFDEVHKLAAETGLRVGRASAPGAEPDPEIVILDKMGVLARAYGLGEASIVAGSFCPVGGHNLLEAAAHAVPVVFGPDMHSQREIYRLFKDARAGLQVEPAALGKTLYKLFSNVLWRDEVGRKGYELLERNRGAAEKAVAAVKAWLD